MVRASRRMVLSLAMAAVLAAAPILAQIDCDPPTEEAWDWEVYPDEVVLFPRDECGGHGPLVDPPAESYFGDALPDGLDGILYGFTFDISTVAMVPDEELALFQLRAAAGEPVLTLRIRNTTQGYAWGVAFVDDLGVERGAATSIEPGNDDLITVAWFRGTETSLGSLELSINGQLLVERDVDNDLTVPREARIGIVDAAWHPAHGSGAVIFFPRAKYWDF